MNPEILDRVVERIILPKYKWIEDFKWYKVNNDGINYWTLELDQDPELDITDMEINELRIEVLKDVSNLFKMISPPKTEQFQNVWVY